MAMKVKLISHTEDPEKIVAAAAKTCYNQKNATDLLRNLTPANIEKFISKLDELGHESPFEHAVFTFSISGVSRVTLAQITRHRIASFSVRSQRYVNETNFSYVVPDTIQSNDQALQIYFDTMAQINDAFCKISALLESDGMDAKKAREDARYVLPNACSTNIVMTMNARSLLNFFRLRCCNRAQWEIRHVAEEMLKQCIKVAPNLFKYAGPSCVDGACSEGEMCCGEAEGVRSHYHSIRGN